MSKMTFDYSNALKFIDRHEIEYLNPMIEKAHDLLHSKKGAGSEYAGWVELPRKYDWREFERIQKTAKKIQENSDALIVIGIGGSYLGARAAVEMLNHQFYNMLPKNRRKTPEIYFAGQNMSSDYLSNLLDIIESKDISVNVISKSGTTTEPAIAFRIFKELMERKYGKAEARNRIYATTDQSKGVLRKLAEEEGYDTFVIPDDIGGRYSVLTSVGLLPIAVSGIDIQEMMEGAGEAYEDYLSSSIGENQCYQYAAVRNVLYKKGKTTEIMGCYVPSLFYLGEWWKQLFGESEGKDGKGIFPASVNFTTDLHSLGQYIQEGRRNIFETILYIDNAKQNITIKEEPADPDGLNYLSGKTVSFVNEKAFEATLIAHIDGNVPNLVVRIPEASPYHFGYLVYFFEKACGISGYLLGVNPFNQPGVEAYKKNMFALLGKPGYEEERRELIKRLKK